MSKLSERVKTAGFNAGMNYYAKMMPVADIGEDPEIAGIFRIHDNTLDSIVKSMEYNGYDKAEPIVLWKGKNVIVDGHTRVKAAIKVGIIEIPVIEKEFDSLEDAIIYTFERQANRRNLEQSEILAAAATLKNKTKDNEDGSGRSAEILAGKLNVAPSTIYRAKKICAEASEGDLKAVQNGKATINEVYKKVKSTKKEKSPDFKFLNKAVTYLVDRAETAAALMLIDCFTRLEERDAFYETLSDEIKAFLGSKK
jgi:ParB family chromosome partitioning protein